MRYAIAAVLLSCATACHQESPEVTYRRLTGKDLPPAHDTTVVPATPEEIQSMRTEDSIATIRSGFRREVRERERAKIFSQLRSDSDEVQGIKWYYAKSTPKYASMNSLHIYIGQSGSGQHWLRLRIQYGAEDWLFIERFVLNVDGHNTTLTPPYGEVQRDNAGGRIWEWWDTETDLNIRVLMRQIASSQKTVLRYTGQQYRFDRTITTGEKQAIDAVLAADGDLDDP